MNWLDKYQNKILIAIWSVIFLTCLFVIFTEPVKASTSGNENNLPFVVDNNLIEDWSFYRANYEELAHAWGYPQSYIDDLNWESNDIIVRSVLNDGRVAYTYVFVPRVSVTPSYSISLSQSYSNFDYSVDYVTIRFTGYEVLQFNTNSSLITNFYGYATSGMSVVSFLGSYPEPVFITGDFVDSNNNLIFTLPNEPLPDIRGHSSPPVDEHGHYIEDGNGNRIPKPNKPTPSVYNPPTIQFPTVDTSSLEKLLESLIDLVQYFISYIGGVINGWFSNLLSNLDSWFDYIVQSFNYAINNVVGAIKDLASTFYNNMFSLFEPLYEFFNGVATFFNNLIQLGIDGDSFSLSTFFYNLLVPDPEEFSQTLLDGDIHHVVPLVQTVRTKFLSLFDSFYNLTPTKVFLIPSFTWHGQTFNLSIDFSWYDDYKVYGDSIITGFLVIGYIYWFVLQLNSMFRGGNSIGHDVMKAGGKE